MIRVLQVVNNMSRTGIETMLMNYYRTIDRTKIQFDFLTHRPFRGDYDDEIESLGGKVYYAPRLYPNNYVKYFNWMKEFWNDHPEYQIVHSHIDAMSYLPLFTAKKAGVPIRIAHSHNTSIDWDYKYLLKEFFKLRLTGVANRYCACGEKAGEYLFGDKDFTVIHNAIDIGQFAYDAAVREDKRRELGIGDQTVIGHVGRFSKQKNHKRLLRIFGEYYKRDKGAVLLLIGTGEYENKIKRLAEKEEFAANVRFLGKQSDMKRVYQAMDIFLMPSFYEGIPLVGIEAQAAGIPCIFSDQVPAETVFTSLCSFLPLAMSDSEWADCIQLAVQQRDRAENNTDSKLYDIRQMHIFLENYYEKLYDQVNGYTEDNV